MSVRAFALRSRFLLNLRTISTSFASSRALSVRVLGNGVDDQERRANDGIQLLRPQQLDVCQRRFRKKGRNEKKDESSDEESSDDEKDPDEEDDLVAKGYTEMTVNINSLRLDTVMKAGTRLGRGSIDEAFYDSRIRVNGERISKKSELVSSRDEIDLILGRNSENNDFIDVMRLEVKDIPDITSGTGRINLPLRRYAKLVIQNYETDPYDGSLLNMTVDKGDKKKS